MKYISELKPAAAQPRPNAKVMTNAMPRIVFGVLEVILRQDPVPGQSFGSGQGQIAFIVSLGVLSVPRLGAGKPRKLISPDGPGASRHRVGHNLRIGAWLRRRGSKFRNVFHVGPYAAPAEAGRRSFEELSSWAPQ